MNDLAIAYHTYSQDILYDRTNYKFIHGEGHDMITTCGGKTYDPDEWVGIVLEGYVNFSVFTKFCKNIGNVNFSVFT